jgi:hypothetical protein
MRSQTSIPVDARDVKHSDSGAEEVLCYMLAIEELNE